MHRHAASVGNNNILNILDLSYHAFRTDIIGLAALFNIAAACVLIVFLKCVKHIGDGKLKS